MIGSIVNVIVDRPLGSRHPKHEDMIYPVNYGYVPGVLAPDGEEQDAYILGADEPVAAFTGRVIAIIHRFDDVEEKWVVAPENVSFSKEEIMEQVAFQEQYFHTEIRTQPAFQISPCTVDDVQTLQTLAIEIFSDTFSAGNTPENMDAYMTEAYNLPKLHRELEDANQMFSFLYADGVLAGYMKVNEAPSQSEINDPKSLEVERIYVSRSYHGTGVGQYLMDRAIEMAISRGKEYLWLGVWEYNHRARRFYEKNGFYRFSEHVFTMGDDDQTDFLLRKDLK